MKLKSYLIILSVLFLLLFYNLFCYWFVNNVIESGTKAIVTNYFDKSYGSDYSYEYLKATMNDDQSINVFVNLNTPNGDEVFRFIVVKNGNYKLIEVNNNIPIYIKKNA